MLMKVAWTVRKPRDVKLYNFSTVCHIFMACPDSFGLTGQRGKGIAYFMGVWYIEHQPHYAGCYSIIGTDRLPCHNIASALD